MATGPYVAETDVRLAQALEASNQAPEGAEEALDGRGAPSPGSESGHTQ